MDPATLLEALRRVVRGETASPLSLADALAALDEAGLDRESKLDAHLRHYLRNRSYLKALAFVEEGTVCDHG